MEEAEELLGGSFYAGMLENEPECEAHAFFDGDQVKLLGKPNFSLQLDFFSRR